MDLLTVRDCFATQLEKYFIENVENFFKASHGDG